MRDMVIGCDNAAVALKDTLKQLLESMGVSVTDMGVSSTEDATAYPLIAQQVCAQIARDGYVGRGLLIYGTGIGMCITANKCKGIRAVVAHDIYSARRSILSNDCNVLCLGARVIGVELAKSILTEWVSLEFADGASTPKVNEMKKVEAKHFRD